MGQEHLCGNIEQEWARYNLIGPKGTKVMLVIKEVFVTGAALMSCHYKTYIISGMGYLRSNLVVPLVLWTIVYNIQVTGIVL
jgi:hypothetical protein